MYVTAHKVKYQFVLKHYVIGNIWGDMLRFGIIYSSEELVYIKDWTQNICNDFPDKKKLESAWYMYIKEKARGRQNRDQMTEKSQIKSGFMEAITNI